MNQDIRIIVLIAAAISIGLIVLAANPNYRISKNWESNKTYYPGIGELTAPQHTPTPDNASPPFDQTFSSGPDQEDLDADSLQSPDDIPLVLTDSTIEF